MCRLSPAVRAFLILAFMVSGPAAASASAGIGVWGTNLYAGGMRTLGRDGPPEAVCVAAILDAEREHGLTDHALLAMGFTEAGRMTADRLFTIWPWTVNTEGESHFFPTREAAIAFVQETQARGVRSIDVGCMQVNLRWHPDAFADLRTAFEPTQNVRYAARFLADLRRERGDLAEAIGRYHSAQSELGDAYRRRVEGNRRWAAQAVAYLDTLAAGPAAATPAWGVAELSRLAFLSSLYSNGPVRPLPPVVAQR